MGGPGHGNEQIGVTLPRERFEYITARGQALDWKRAKTINKIIDFWIALGAPPLSEPEAARGFAPPPAEIRVRMIDPWSEYARKAPSVTHPVRNQ